jgi:hypothetical protein
MNSVQYATDNQQKALIQFTDEPHQLFGAKRSGFLVRSGFDTER